MSALLDKLEIELPKCGKVNVFVRGVRSPSEVVVFTVHDIGCNHIEFDDFALDPNVRPLTNRIVWIHLDIPGQSEDDPDLSDDFEFPSMQGVADDLIHAFDQLEVHQAVVIGEGAGANILARFAAAHEDRVLGAVLIHCIGSTAKLLESVQERIISRKLTNKGMHAAAENYLVLHRYGAFKEAKSEQNFLNLIDNFRESLRKTINPRNLTRYINSYMTRDSLIEKIKPIKCPVLFMTGVKASHIHAVRVLHESLVKSMRGRPAQLIKVEFVQIDDCANCLAERPQAVAESLQYFMQGLGLVVCVLNRRQSDAMSTIAYTKPRSRTMSMIDHDQPKGVSAYMFDPRRKYSVGVGYGGDSFEQ